MDFKELKVQANKDTLKGTNLNDIEDMYRGLSKIETKLQNLKNKIIDGYSALQADLELTVQMLKRWNNTKDKLSGDDAPSQIKERIRTVINDIND